MPRRPKTRNRFEEIRKKRAELTELEKEIIAAIAANELTESEREEQESHKRYAAADAKVRRRKKADEHTIDSERSKSVDEENQHQPDEKEMMNV